MQKLNILNVVIPSTWCLFLLIWRITKWCLSLFHQVLNVTNNVFLTSYSPLLMPLSLVSLDVENNNLDLGYLLPKLNSLCKLRRFWVECHSKIQLKRELRRFLDDLYDANLLNWKHHTHHKSMFFLWDHFDWDGKLPHSHQYSWQGHITGSFSILLMFTDLFIKLI
jgi:hypothetical protein